MDNLEYLAVHKCDFTYHRTIDGKFDMAGEWDVARPETFGRPGMDEILNLIGTKGRPDRRLAVSYTFSYLQFPAGKVAESVENMLNLSLLYDVPVIVHLDGVNWWLARPDLWNFWDESKPGYNPDNIRNVERYGWGMDTAVKTGWRNWGMQIRVPPAPNLASPAFLAEQTKVLDIILPVISGWYGALPENKKYLLGGVVFGWELSTYVQAYFYENGNEIFENDPAEDPQGNIEADTLALGYAAAETLGIQAEGAITEETEDRICSFYMDFLIQAAIRHGIDPKKIIAHSFYGLKAKNGGGQSGAASVSDVEGVIPGWSWYDEDFAKIDRAIDKANGKKWAAIEVKPFGLTPEVLEHLFAHRENRYVNIYNWEGIMGDRNTLNAIAAALK